MLEEYAGVALPPQELEQSNTKLDFSLETPEARVEKCKEILAAVPAEQQTPYYLEGLAYYILDADYRQQKKIKKRDENRNIITKNRNKTFLANETSLEGIIGKYEEGNADTIYTKIANDKDIIMHPKDPISEKDIAEVPGLREFREDIAKVEQQLKMASGSRARLLKKQLIEMRQDQYVMRSAYIKPVQFNNPIRAVSKACINENIKINKRTGELYSDAVVSLIRPDDVSAILCDYSHLKEDTWEDLDSDMRWTLIDLENLVDKVLKDEPYYFDLLVYKIDGKSNSDIQQLLYEKYGIRNSVEYLSSLWRNKIPKLIAEEAQREYLEWYYTNKEKGYWKRCGRCGEIKLAHNLFFSKNKSSKDGWYSICKCCRNKKE